jgi:glycosyltransferase involved in cell wall biosynthesis
VIGEGEQAAELRKVAGPTISFLGFQPDEVVRSHFQRCKALLFPGEEDIGLTPIEAQASGRPVIAYARGGALESIAGVFPGEIAAPDAHTGVFFDDQSPEALIDAIRAFEVMEQRFSPRFIRAHAQQFDEARFRHDFAEFVYAKWQEFVSPAEHKEAVSAHQP